MLLNQLNIEILRCRGKAWPLNGPEGAMHEYLLSAGHRQMPTLLPQYGHSRLFFMTTSVFQLFALIPSVTGFPVQLISRSYGIQSVPAYPQAVGTLSVLSSQ